jgi:hypothetical protein
VATLTVHLFKASLDPFVELLNEHQVAYQRREIRPGAIMAAGMTLEIVQAVGSAAFWPSLATVVVAFINSRRGRKVIITTKDGAAVHAEGLTQIELEKVLEQARNLTAIDTDESKSSE